ncbi:hypothetical protein GOP47_0020474 [Adiantum capillus-veneris]|uniref:DCD domain-containing protein n=1 Tax=Adiantum capillus-veneris TaxID=13818 RepID=A0A9D4Z707_ADICA|nr:hypothetical protein GOP47_0020474 [Adiantum capillus-veneris]
MASMYAYEMGGVGAYNEGKKKLASMVGINDQNEHYLNQAVEDQQWTLVAKKLAFEDQMRAKADLLQLGSANALQTSTSSSKPLPAPIQGKPSAANLNNKPANTSSSSSSSSIKHKHRGGASAQTEMVNRMINKLLALDTNSSSKLIPPSQKGLLSHTTPILPDVLPSSKNTFSSTSSLDRKFKTLPPAESLSRNETLGGYIFVCNNDTMQEDLKRQLFGLPQRYRDSVRAIQPGLPLFLYNYTTHQLHGVFEAASFGGSNIDPSAWEDKKNKGESRFPAQVRIRVRKICKALDEDAFRPVLFHYDGPKFRLQLSVPETLALLDLFMENGF